DRRSAVEARYAEEIAALDAELGVIETLDLAASEFALRHRGEVAAAALEITPQAELGSSDGSEESGGRDILKPGSRWRLHLGNRPLDPEGTVASPPSAP